MRPKLAACSVTVTVPAVNKTQAVHPCSRTQCSVTTIKGLTNKRHRNRTHSDSHVEPRQEGSLIGKECLRLHSHRGPWANNFLGLVQPKQVCEVTMQVAPIASMLAYTTHMEETCLRDEPLSCPQAVI